MRHTQIVRQWKLLLLLDANVRGLTVDHLRARLSADVPVTERTIRRDIDALTLAGFPIEVMTRYGGHGQTLIALDRSQWRGGDVVFRQPAHVH